ncbi:MAG TPA: hypothetical protein VFN35_13100 [Ktedonobacteraceae bacterium]|nr:hypothetical protein [Ktedonobacteraceae bacterium]
MSDVNRATIPHLASLGNIVPDGYEYEEKIILPGEDLNLPQVYLKWYDIRHPEREITPAQVASSRAFLVSEIEAGRLQFQDELGFAILHHCGSVLLLLLTTWRNTNELWEALYVKEVPETGGYAPVADGGCQRGTYCVWELGAVWHERQAWVRYLRSSRDEEAKYAYLTDRFSGCC